MVAILLLLAFVALCVLGACCGVDSRPVEPLRHRSDW
jgi:hypothetical protein